MRATWVHEGAILRLTLLLDGEDEAVSPHRPYLRMLTNVATVELPAALVTPHPDLLALAAYSIAWPWTRTRLRMAGPVSDHMREAFAVAGIQLSGEGTCDARPPGDRLSLAYSGGADSIAVSEVVAQDTAFVHLRRVKHPRVVNRMTHVRVDAVEALVRQAAGRGRDLTVVRTDLEYLCLPYATYPVWWAISIASILTADSTGAGGVALGTVLESRYTGNGVKYVGHVPESTTHGLYAAAGIPLVRPAAGMTEVVTTRLAAESDLADLARSCLLGPVSTPCLRCDKCVRKELIAAAVTGGQLPARLVANMAQVPQMTAKMLAEPPLYFQDMLEYALARVDVGGTPLEATRDLLAPTVEGTIWAEHYYTPALRDEVPERFRSGIAARVAERVEPMTEAEQRVVETWDARGRVLPAETLQPVE